MNRNIRSGLVLAASLMCAASTLAAESAAEAGKRCAQVLGERERLACFDRAFAAGPETAALTESRAATAAAPVAPAAPVRAPAAPAAVAAPVAAASVAGAAVGATAPVAAAPAVAAPSLGDEQVRKTEKKAKDAPAEPTTLTARVTAVKETRQDTWRMNLDNGQVWQQMDMTSSFQPEVGDSVQIQRKMMGGYTLALAGDKKSPWIRVSRLE